MSQWRPIVADCPNERIRLLLRSATLDVPSNTGKCRTLAALGLGGAALGTAELAGAAAGGGVPAAKLASSVAVMVVKWVGLGAIGGVLVSGAGLTLDRRVEVSTRTGVQASIRVPVSSLGDDERLSASRVMARQAPGSQESVVLRGPDRPTPPTPKSSPSPLAAPALVARADSSVREPGAPPPLAAEIASLDGAQRALAAGRPAAALDALDAYRREFPVPRLGPEATVLRIQSLVALGRTAEARELGTKLLGTHPGNAFAQRVQSILGLPTTP